MKKIFYFDASNGVAGDMFVAAMIDMGADFDKIKKDVTSLGLDVDVRHEKSSSYGIAASKFLVTDKKTGLAAQDSGAVNEHRHLGDIVQIIENSKLENDVKRSSIKVFELIAAAEAAAHGIPAANVHFHEVGALDSIADIVAASSAYHQFDADKSFSSFINLGSGSVRCQHGVLPVPAPAVLHLLKGAGAYSDGVKRELATPTGVALLKHFCDDFIDMPKIKVLQSGCGMGAADIGRPDIFRVLLGEA